MTRNVKDINSNTIVAGLLVGLLIGIWCATASADGLIVPVEPSVRVRGAWAVEYHHVDVIVRDQIAAVSIDQKFVNLSSGMIEVEYLFPVPPDAAIDGMTLVVNGKEFAAKLLKADEARRIYEDIVRRKKDPALLEYAGFGMLRSRAFPLEPGKPARVQVTYKQVCKKAGQAVEVWYPLNTEKFSARKISDVRVTVDIKADADISAVYSPSHSLSVDRKDPRHVIATYHEKDALPTTDIQVFYKTSDSDVAATFLTHQPDPEKDGYFLMLVSPNPRLKDAKAMPKDVVIVFDHSGSMMGEKLRQTKQAVEYILKHLNAEDRFNVVAYNDAVESFRDNLLPAEEKNVKEALDMLDRIDATGGTNIEEALRKGLSSLETIVREHITTQNGQPDPRREMPNPNPKYIIFLTDGLPTVGVTEEKGILDSVKKCNTVGVRLFNFGVGYDVNVPLLDKLSDQNGGRSDYVKPNEPVEAKVTALYNRIRNPVMTGLSVEIAGVKIRDMYPRQLGDLFEGDQIVVAGRYDARDMNHLTHNDGADRTRCHSQLLVKGKYQGRERVFEYPVTFLVPSRRGYEFIEKLWAMRRVGYLMDQVQLHGKTKEVEDEIIRLSRQYGIMTPYTSFLADETTNLADRAEIHAKGDEFFGRLSSARSGGVAQRGAAMRKELSESNSLFSPMKTSAPGEAAGQMVGNTSELAYEADRKETVANLRQAGNQAIYRRGRVWVAANAAKLDLEKDKDKIQVVERYSKAYFGLIRANNVEENQVLASQQPEEELLITLRGQAYLIR
ncbi:MAG: VWA domain-containing protein [Phycisphaerae bacterium]|nr:VWA domain-containing protein [Phycisphaerae bacterium]